MLWIAEGKSPAIRHDSPVFHCITAENYSLHFLDVQNNDSTAGQQSIFHMNLTIVTVRNNELLQQIVTYPLEPAIDAAAGATSIKNSEQNQDDDDNHPDKRRQSRAVY